MSNMATKVQSILLELFPSKPFPRVISEYYVKFKNTRLFFDFYLKELEVLIEIQGKQHTQFVKHFHEDMQAFYRQKSRDNLKIEYAEKHGKCLVRIYDTEDVDRELVFKKIKIAMEEGFCE